MNYYVVIDTNVLVSAMLKWESVPGNVVSFAFDGPIIPVLNEQIIKEYREVLLRPKFHFTEGIVDAVFCGTILYIVRKIHNTPHRVVDRG